MRSRSLASAGPRAALVAAIWIATLSLPSCDAETDPSSDPARSPERTSTDAQVDRPLATRTIAFSVRTRMPAGSENIFVARADGSRLRRVTRRPGGNFDPDWSPDGRKLAFRSEPAESEPAGAVGAVWVVNADGSGLFNLTRRAGMASGAVPSWAPTGDRIALSGTKAEGEPPGIYSVSLDGSQSRRLTPMDREAQYPAWSPDGRRIAFTLVQDGDFDLYMMKPDGSGLRALTNTPEPENWPMWSPDSRRIAFSSEEGPAAISIVNADGSGRRVVSGLRGGGVPGNWAPGDRLIFACPAGSDSNAIGTCAIRAGGAGFERLLRGVDASFPAWKP